MIKRVIAIISRGEVRDNLIVRRQAEDERKSIDATNVRKEVCIMEPRKIPGPNNGELEMLDLAALIELIESMKIYINRLYDTEDKQQQEINSLKKEIRKIQDERFLYMKRFSIVY